MTLEEIKQEIAKGIKSSDEKQATMTPDQRFQSGLKNSQNVHRDTSIVPPKSVE